MVAKWLPTPSKYGAIDNYMACFDEIASHFKTKVEFPQEALEGVSDEQYVRNIVDVLFKATS